jgi:hypothetical protein
VFTGAVVCVVGRILFSLSCKIVRPYGRPLACPAVFPTLFPVCGQNRRSKFKEEIYNRRRKSATYPSRNDRNSLVALMCTECSWYFTEVCYEVSSWCVCRRKIVVSIASQPTVTGGISLLSTSPCILWLNQYSV